MTRTLVLAVALAVASTAGAQSVPNISGIKQTTKRAVNKTNAHTLAMTGADSATAGAPGVVPAGTPTASPGGTSTAAAKNADAAKAAESPAAAAGARGVRATAAPATTHAAAAADTAQNVVLRREVFSYEQSGRRDPFVSLMTVGELRPMISDLVLVGVLIDPTGRNSVAVLRDINTKEQYRARVGQQLGRMRVARIAQKSVTFTIEEFGYSRQQVLAMDDSNQERTK